MSLPLQVVGWQPFDQETLDMVEKYPRLVMVYSHNSMFDFWISMFLLRAHPLLRRRTRTIVNRKFMNFPVVGSFLKQWNCISGTGYVRGQGTLSQLVTELNAMKEFIVPISPKGDIAARSWRSGYYQIAKQTGAFLVVGCFDYHNHKFVLNQPFDISNMSLQEVESKCKNQMKQVPAINLKHLEYPHPQQEVKLNVSCITNETFIRNFWSILLVVLVLVLVALLWKFYNKNRGQF